MSVAHWLCAMGETWGAGVETQKTKIILYHYLKRTKTKHLISPGRRCLLQHYDTRFPYYISLSTISWRSGNGNVTGTNWYNLQPKSGLSTEYWSLYPRFPRLPHSARRTIHQWIHQCVCRRSLIVRRRSLVVRHGVATIRRLLQIIGLFCKRAL